MKQLGLETLQDRRKIDKATIVFRIKYQLIDIKENQHFKPAKRVLRGQAQKYQVPQLRTQIVRLEVQLASGKYSEFERFGV